MVSNFVVTRLTATASSFAHHRSTQIQLGSLLLYKHHNAFLFFFNSLTSDRNSHKGDNFTMSYLIQSCGLTPELAKKLSNEVSLKNPEGSNAVLALLKNYGFSKTQVAKLVAKHPKVLAANAENTLLPKLKFFFSIGVSNNHMPKILIANHKILLRSTEKCLIPRYEILRRVVRDDQEVVRVLRKAPFSFTYCDMMNHLVPNIEVLRQCGVPQASISLLMANFPAAPYKKHSEFVETIKTIKEIGFNPLKTSFVMAIQVVSTLSKAAWESRFLVYEKWGWNREMVLQAFLKYPNFIKLCDETVTKKMSFLVKDMGLSSEDIAEYPAVLAYNFEKRIIPRFSLIKILKSKGLVKNNLRFCSFVGMTEENFLKKFVISFQEDLPLLPDVYKDGYSIKIHDAALSYAV